MDGSIEDIQKLRGHNLPFFDHSHTQHGHFFNLNVYKNRRFCKPSIHMLSTYFLNAPLKNNAYCAMHTFYLSILTEIVFCYYRFLDFLWGNFFMSSRWNRDKKVLKIIQLIHCYDRFVTGFSSIHFIGYKICQCQHSLICITILYLPDALMIALVAWNNL